MTAKSIGATAFTRRAWISGGNRPEDRRKRQVNAREKYQTQANREYASACPCSLGPTSPSCCSSRRCVAAARGADTADVDPRRFPRLVRLLLLPEEQALLQELRDDEDRRAFQEIFWARRDPTPGTAATSSRRAFAAPGREPSSSSRTRTRKAPRPGAAGAGPARSAGGSAGPRNRLASTPCSTCAKETGEPKPGSTATGRAAVPLHERRAAGRVRPRVPLRRGRDPRAGPRRAAAVLVPRPELAYTGWRTASSRGRPRFGLRGGTRLLWQHREPISRWRSRRSSGCAPQGRSARRGARALADFAEEPARLDRRASRRRKRRTAGYSRARQRHRVVPTARSSRRGACR